MEFHPDMLSTGQLTSHDPGSPYHFLNHTTIGSRYPEKGYDDFFVFDRRGEQVQSPHLPDFYPLIIFNTADPKDLQGDRTSRHRFGP